MRCRVLNALWRSERSANNGADERARAARSLARLRIGSPRKTDDSDCGLEIKP